MKCEWIKSQEWSVRLLVTVIHNVNFISTSDSSLQLISCRIELSGDNHIRSCRLPLCCMSRLKFKKNKKIKVRMSNVNYVRFQSHYSAPSSLMSITSINGGGRTTNRISPSSSSYFKFASSILDSAGVIGNVVLSS